MRAVWLTRHGLQNTSFDPWGHSKLVLCEESLPSTVREGYI